MTVTCETFFIHEFLTVCQMTLLNEKIKGGEMEQWTYSISKTFSLVKKYLHLIYAYLAHLKVSDHKTHSSYCKYNQWKYKIHFNCIFFLIKGKKNYFVFG